MSWVVVAAIDQTIMFIDRNCLMTEDHAEAVLFPTREQAEEAAAVHGDSVEEVFDEAEFKSRPDTW